MKLNSFFLGQLRPTKLSFLIHNTMPLHPGLDSNVLIVLNALFRISDSKN